MTIRADFSNDLAIGESVAICGICLTAIGRGGGEFSADVSPTTLSLTTAGEWRPGTRLNLERALALGDRLGGHIVSGHVDGVGRLVRKDALGNSTKLWFDLPEDLARVCLPLGSIAVDGVSLTLGEVEKNRFAVTIIPETARKATLGELAPGSPVNIETDVIGKYVQRLLSSYIHPGKPESGTPEGISWAKLAELGYLSH